MSDVKAANTKVPKLRFPEFKGEWEKSTLRSAFNNSRVKGYNGLPIYSVTLDRGMVRRDSLERVMGADAADEANLKVAKGNLAYNMMRMWQGAVGLAPEDSMVSPAYVILEPKSQTNSAYYFQWMKSPKAIYKLWAYSHGLTSDRLRLYFDDFAQIHKHIPTLPEQKKIAEFLGAMDEKIAKLKKKKALLTDYKRGVMQKLFAQKIRFTRDDGSPFPDWEEKKLSSVLQEHGLKSTGYEQVHSVSVHKGVINQIDHLGRSFAAKETSHYNRAQIGDVIYTKSPTGDFPFGIVKQNKLRYEVIVSPLYGVFKPETKSLGYILEEHFSSCINMTNYLKPLVQKGAKNTINVSNEGFLRGKLTLPTHPDEQKKIADFLSAIDQKIEAVATQITQTEAFKKGLLQQMFV